MNFFYIAFTTWFFTPALFTIGGLTWAMWREDPIDILRRVLIVLPLSNVVWIIAGALK